MAKRASSSKAKAKIGKVMKEFKEGELKSGPEGKGGVVKDRAQAVAIALNEARDAGARVSRKRP